MRMCMVRPLAIVSIYLPTAAKIANPDMDTTLVISPATPRGANLIMIPVIFIITSKEDAKKFRRKSECFGSIRVRPTPRNIAKKINLDHLKLLA